MKKMIFIIVLLLLPFFCHAQDQTYKARVIEVIAEQNRELSDGTQARQQKLKLKILDGDKIGQEIVFDGFGDYDALKKNIYQVDDKVLLLASYDDTGKVNYYITDYVRTNSLFLLTVLFGLSIIVVGGIKGFRSLLSLIATFFVVVKYIIPQILAGANPLFVTLLGSFIILLIIIYITEGFRINAHIAVVSIFISLVITVLISWVFVDLAQLSGLASEEVSFLVGLNSHTINFQGLLLAAIIIGTLGVLDDIVIAQVATAEEIMKADPYKSKLEVFKSTYRVGVSHISSMTNTLFLAYVGVSLPLLILFVSGKSAFSTWSQIANNEAIATEIVRTLAGSIGLILSVPISTGIAVWWLFARKK